MLFRTGQKLHIDIFKESQIVQTLHTPAGSKFVERLTFFITQFTENDVIFRFIIAFNGNVFNDAFCQIDLQHAFLRNFYILHRIQKISLLKV